MRWMSWVLVAVIGCNGSTPAPEQAPPADPAASGLPAGHPPAGGAPAAASAAGMIVGVVGEVLAGGGYTYVSIKAEDGREIWAAGPETVVKAGEKVTVPAGLPMKDFSSPTLNRTFAEVLFVDAIYVGDAAPAAAPAAPAGGMVGGTPGHAEVGAMEVEKIAPPAGGVAIADAISQRATYSGKPVVVKGKVVKATQAMGKWFFHLQDGSGDAAAKTHDLTVTSANEVQVGEVITVSGTLSTDKDLGMGYFYPAILEDAVIAR